MSAAETNGRMRTSGANKNGRSGRLTLLAWIVLATPSCFLLGERVDEPDHVVRGPLPTRIQHPLGLTYLSFRPRRAQVLEAGRQAFAATTTYSSIFEVSADATSRVAFDGEFGRTAACWRRGLGNAWDLEVELPFLYTTSGFLDAFVEEFHAVFGFGGGGREFFPRDQFDMSIVTDGQTIYSATEDHFGLGDVPVVLTHQLREETPEDAAVAVRVGVELPTGSESDGFGNGELDFGVGLVSERSRGRTSYFGGLDLYVNGASSDFDAAGIDANNLLMAQGGLEYRWSDRLSLLLQVVFQTFGYVNEIDLEEIDARIVDLGVGVAADAPGDSQWVLSFHEDAIAAAGADFSVLFSWSWGL